MFGEQIYEIPIIISFNKYDLVDQIEFNKNQFLNSISINRFSSLSINKTIAIDGKGILDAFNKLINYIFPQLTIKMSLTN
jgi:hypothetical protein